MAINQPPIHRVDWSSQATLVNVTFPEEVKQILFIIKTIDSAVDCKEAITLALSWFRANIPPYKKFFIDYKQLLIDLNSCYNLKVEWLKNNPTLQPISLKEKIYLLYETWWEAYNDSGAGIRGSIYVPRDVRTKNAISQV